MQQIARNIYYEDSYYGVTLGAILFPQSTILIDAPLRLDEARSWRSTLLNLKSSPHRILVNLDAHPDRTLGARALECTIVTHQKTAQVFRNRPSLFKGQTPESGAEWEVNNEIVGTRWASPDIIFTHRMLFHFGEPEVILEHHPGPSLGAVWLVIPDERIVFVGDAVVENQPPFLAYADLPAWFETLNLLLSSYRDYLIISGRSGPATNEVVRTHQQYLRNVLKGVERLAKRNAPPEMTETLIPGLLEGISAPTERLEHFAQRLRHGLYNYYTHHYHPTDNPDQD